MWKAVYILFDKTIQRKQLVLNANLVVLPLLPSLSLKTHTHTQTHTHTRTHTHYKLGCSQDLPFQIISFSQDKAMSLLQN
jgi:hypothetical protein